MEWIETVPSETPIRRESLTDQTARAIREGILNGKYRLGQKLRESDLVKGLGVSSSVIREALHILQGEGIVISKPYCGRMVFDSDSEETAELTVMRASLESYAAYLAARKMRPEAADRILAAAARFTSKEPRSYGEWVEGELRFHRTVWEASGNQWLVRQLTQISMPTFALRILRHGGTDMGELWRNSTRRETETDIHGHQALARALARGDAKESRRLMILHIDPGPSQDWKDILMFEEHSRHAASGQPSEPA